MSGAVSYIYYGDNNVVFTNAVIDLFEKKKVTYHNSVLGTGIVAIVYLKTPRIKKLVDELSELYTGKTNP